MATIRTRDNGPLLVEGDDVRVTDSSGDAFFIEGHPVALCRCGHSGKKPFCDGSHNRTGFQASEKADESRIS